MRKALLSTALATLLVPVPAAAKTGIEFHRYPETAKVGAAIPFTMTVWREPRSRTGHATPVRGIRPLVTFKSASGRVIRVRTARTNRYGLAQGSVRFTDKGPWNVSYDLERRGIYAGEEISQPIHVGTGLTQTIPSADQTRRALQSPATPTAGGFPWIWVLSLASLGSALLLVGMRRRRGHWGAA